MDDDEAIWRLAEAMSILGRIKQSSENIEDICKTVIANMPPQQAWKVVNGLLSTFSIVVRKKPERVTDLDGLSGAEIAWRYLNWECSDPKCPEAFHCRECGKHGRYGDGHECKCQACLHGYNGKQCPNCGRKGGTPNA